MAKFELHYRHELSYDNKMEIDIRFEKWPDKEDYQTLLDAIEKLDSLREKYLPTVKSDNKDK